MSRLVRLLFLSICAALARPGLAEHEKHKHSSRWHTDWLVVVHHYNESLKWLEDLPFHHHVKVRTLFSPLNANSFAEGWEHAFLLD